MIDSHFDHLRAVLHSDCVRQTLEGPGITVSQCPTCKQPGWKKELQPAHKLASLVDHLRTLLIQSELFVDNKHKLFCAIHRRQMFK